MQITRFFRWLLMAVVLLAVPVSSFAGVFVSVTVAPPPLPVYTQPACPGDGYIWTPGYWAWGAGGYYWVPGTWVLAPRPGFLWTPGYWGWSGGVYVWHAGYWGPHVGFYGGVNYGFGYGGVGFAGGEWRGGTFFYNRSVSNVNVTNVHIYNRTVINNVTVNRVSYNGGRGGLNARPTRQEQMAMNERHFASTRMQMQHEHAASTNRDLLASVNHGHPGMAATARPGEFHAHGADGSRAAGAPARPENRPVPERAMNRNVPHPQNGAHPIE
ncbi:MAG: YXWGXW repeat-containing protein, partial [Acidobacteria bacterium]|nr:YXWGXW repeat-containing protein [Acidobacteriota bacterium]